MINAYCTSGSSPQIETESRQNLPTTPTYTNLADITKELHCDFCNDVLTKPAEVFQINPHSIEGSIPKGPKSLSCQTWAPLVSVNDRQALAERAPFRRGYPAPLLVATPWTEFFQYWKVASK